MALHISDLPVETVGRFRKWATRSTPVCLLPGPVQISPSVKACFAAEAVSHRSASFIAEFQDVRAHLQTLAGGMQVGLFPGSGTLANDIVGVAIAADATKHSGLVLANGEFGNRLVRHARSWRLPHKAMYAEWGSRWGMQRISACLDENPGIDWIWAVQLETSTGMANDTSGLMKLAYGRGVGIYLDCVSGFGAGELDLRCVTLANAVSGKSLAGYGGLAIVLANENAVGD